jgi:predicted transcriptional regulator
MKRKKNNQLSKNDIILNEVPVLITSETIGDFFTRGRNTAQVLDQKKRIKPRRIISFEEPHDLLKFLSENKLKLVSTVRSKPNSISGLAKYLKRSRTSIGKDVQELEAVGILISKYVGRSRLISAASKKPIKLQAVI